jgi:hypothetical protein
MVNDIAGPPLVILDDRILKLDVVDTVARETVPDLIADGPARAVPVHVEIEIAGVEMATAPFKDDDLVHEEEGAGIGDDDPAGRVDSGLTATDPITVSINERGPLGCGHEFLPLQTQASPNHRRPLLYGSGDLADFATSRPVDATEPAGGPGGRATVGETTSDNAIHVNALRLLDRWGIFL